MMEWGLIVLPLAMAGVALGWSDEGTRPWLLPVTTAGHCMISWWLLVAPPVVEPAAWLGFDALARAVLPAVSVLFLASSAYGVAYLKLRSERRNRIFVAALLALMGFVSLALQSRHLGLMWVAIEAATLAAGPLIHFNGTARAIEATWKYLLVSGTGVALALLGSFCLGYASLVGGGGGDLTFIALAAQGKALARPWVLIAWVLLLVGYGTKMGLAPMQTWKPDAYGEAPGIVGALLAGGTTTAAFVALLRVREVVDAAGAGSIANETLLGLGLFSMLLAALFLLATRDFKRMLAYSSVEHVGILSIGAALGPAGLWAALYHVWNHCLTEGSLFMSAGNIRRAAGARTAEEVSGMAVRTPASAMLFTAGMFATTACPPFGTFFSEIRIVRSAFETGHAVTGTLILACLLPAFCGVTRLVFAIVDGRPRAAARQTSMRSDETAGVVLPAGILLGLSLWLGIATPALLREAWSAAVQHLVLPP